MPRVLAERSDVIPVLGEVFRELGFSAASLTEITNRTGLGKGSLYHFFPMGKTEMAEAVLNDIDQWFENNIYQPLRESEEPLQAMHNMFKEVNRYFRSGNRICLVGAFALDNTRDQYSEKISNYFKSWMHALTLALKRSGIQQNKAKSISEDTVASIQGALVLARSQDDAKIFKRTLTRLEERIMASLEE